MENRELKPDVSTVHFSFYSDWHKKSERLLWKIDLLAIFGDNIICSEGLFTIKLFIRSQLQWMHGHIFLIKI